MTGLVDRVCLLGCWERGRVYVDLMGLEWKEREKQGGKGRLVRFALMSILNTKVFEASAALDHAYVSVVSNVSSELLCF